VVARSGELTGDLKDSVDDLIGEDSISNTVTMAADVRLMLDVLRLK